MLWFAASPMFELSSPPVANAVTLRLVIFVRSNSSRGVRIFAPFEEIFNPCRSTAWLENRLAYERSAFFGPRDDEYRNGRVSDRISALEHLPPVMSGRLISREIAVGANSRAAPAQIDLLASRCLISWACQSRHHARSPVIFDIGHTARRRGCRVIGNEFAGALSGSIRAGAGGGSDVSR